MANVHVDGVDAEVVAKLPCFNDVTLPFDEWHTLDNNIVRIPFVERAQTEYRVVIEFNDGHVDSTRWKGTGLLLINELKATRFKLEKRQV